MNVNCKTFHTRVILIANALLLLDMSSASMKFDMKVIEMRADMNYKMETHVSSSSTTYRQGQSL
jgi:hypothetical protein